MSNETENDAVYFADGTLICSCAWKLQREGVRSRIFQTLPSAGRRREPCSWSDAYCRSGYRQRAGSGVSPSERSTFYVSMSRARSAMYLFTDSKVALPDAITRPSKRLSFWELANGAEKDRALIKGRAG